MVKKLKTADAASRHLLMIVLQEPAQSLAAPHRSLALLIRRRGKQQDVALPLMVSLSVEMVNVFAQRTPQGALAE
jgi:hypothetical protein